MISKLVILFFATLLTLGQGRVALRSLKLREAGWGKFKFAQSNNPKGYSAMVTLDLFLFAALCVWLVFDAKQLLQ